MGGNATTSTDALRARADRLVRTVDGACRSLIDIRRRLGTLRYPDDVTGPAVSMLVDVSVELEAIQAAILALRPGGGVGTPTA